MVYRRLTISIVSMHGHPQIVSGRNAERVEVDTSRTGVELPIERAEHSLGESSDDDDSGSSRIAYEEVLERINARYEVDLPRRYSSAIDALASFVRGKKHMHEESRRYASSRLLFLMVPALIASAVQPILIQTDSIQCTENGKIIVGTLAGLVTCLLGIVTLLRLDASVESHRVTGHQYDKLQSLLEFQSGQVLLFSSPSLGRSRTDIEIRAGLTEVRDIERISSLSDEDSEEKKADVQRRVLRDVAAARVNRKRAETALVEKMKKLVSEVETKIKDIKELSQFPIPTAISCKYPMTARTNIFSIIKRVDDARTQTVTDLTYVINEMRRQRALGQSVDALRQKKRRLCNTIIYLNSAYSIIDDLYASERTGACSSNHSGYRWRSPPIMKWILDGASKGEWETQLLTLQG